MDLMLTMTDLSKMCDTLGFPAFVPKLDGQTFLHNQRIGKVVPLGIFFPKHFLYCLLCNAQYRHHVVGAATGTTVKHTSPKRILSYTTTMPKLGTLIDTFEDFARPLFLQINSLIETNQKLRTARDLLLPKLMSGEISV
jgi:type I restriction enzyme S subunit